MMLREKLIAACIDTNLILTYKGNHQIIERVRCEWDPSSMSQRKTFLRRYCPEDFAGQLTQMRFF